MGVGIALSLRAARKADTKKRNKYGHMLGLEPNSTPERCSIRKLYIYQARTLHHFLDFALGKTLL
jgi:hypothetical protein